MTGSSRGDKLTTLITDNWLLPCTFTFYKVSIYRILPPDSYPALFDFLMSLDNKPRPKFKFNGGRTNVDVDFLVNNNQQTLDQNNGNNNQNNGLVG